MVKMYLKEYNTSSWIRQLIWSVQQLKLFIFNVVLMTAVDIEGTVEELSTMIAIDTRMIFNKQNHHGCVCISLQFNENIIVSGSIAARTTHYEKYKNIHISRMCVIIFCS